MSPRRLAAALAVLPLAAAVAAAAPVDLKADAAAHRVVVTVDGRPFTAYRYEPELRKPVLFPLRSAKGTIVTRGFPIEPREGEPKDHPHHAGCWLTYGDVNGVDIWNKKGDIRQKRVVRAEGGNEQGVLEVEAEWLDAAGQPMLAEATRFVFRGGPGVRAFDRITTLTAVGQRVDLKDNKEGMFGIRVAKALHGDGKPGETGTYRSSEGVTGKAVWGTRARWMLLAGTVDGEDVTVAIFDHPKNVNHPTYWHARTYGLFAANPLGQKDFDKAKGELGFALEPGTSTTFRYRVLLVSGSYTPEQADAEFKRFAAAEP